MGRTMNARYDSRPWGQRTNATREWVLEVEEPGVVDGGLSFEQVLPDELLSVAGVDVLLGPAERAALARLELAAFTEWQIRFEAVVQAGFAKQVATSSDLGAGRVTFLLHEIGEEAGHQRLFQSLLLQVPEEERTTPPGGAPNRTFRRLLRVVARYPAMLFALVLAGEEIVDQFQERAADDPRTDPYVRAVYDFHRTEEANHVAFVQAVYAEVWATADPVERALVRRLAPRLISMLFDATVRPEDYDRAGAPPDTWARVRTSQTWRDRRADAVRPVLRAMQEAGAFPANSVPAAWKRIS